MQPHGRKRGRQGHADRRISGRGKRPIECGTNIVDLPSKTGHIVYGNSQYFARRSRHDEFPEELSVSACGFIGLAAFGEFFERIGPDRLEQPPSTRWYRSVPGHKRLGDEACDALTDSGGGMIAVAHDSRRGLEPETCREDP